MLYFSIHREQMRDNQLLAADRDSIQNDLTELIVEYDDLKYKNDSIAANLERANDLVEQLKRERRWNYNKLKQYEKELGTLRTVMMGYIRQIARGANGRVGEQGEGRRGHPRPRHQPHRAQCP